MSKSDIIRTIAQRTGLGQNQVAQVIDQFLSLVRTNVIEGNRVQLRGFGSFYPKYRKEKVGRIIASAKTIKIPAHVIPAFKPAKSFSQSIKKQKALLEKFESRAKK